MLNADICEKTAVVCAAVAGAAVAGSLAVGGLALAGGVLTLPAIWRSFREKDKADFKKVFKKVGQEVANEFPALIKGEKYEASALTIASAAMGQIVEIIPLDPELLTKLGRDNVTMADWLVEQAAKTAPEDYAPGDKLKDKGQIETNRRILHQALKLTFDRLDGEPLFEQQIVPFFQKEVFSRFNHVDGELADIKSSLAKLVQASEVKGITQTAKDAGVHNEAIVKLAQRIVEDISDPEAAFAELERAVEIAIRVQQEGRAGSNLDAFVSDVLAQVAELSSTGDNDGAAAFVDTAFAQWQERQEREKMAGVKILQSGLDQDILRRNEDAVATRLIQIAEIEYPGSDERFEHLRGVRDEWYKRGLTRGLMLDLQVAATLAAKMVDQANGPEQKGMVLNDQAVALASLGQRAGGELGQDYLQQAVDAYDLALEIYTRKDMPADWAMTQMNRANALASLGERAGREQGQNYLQQAVDAYDLALAVCTRKDMPADWAMTQMNRANALTSLGERVEGEQGQDYLQQAIAAYDLALAVYTRKDMPADWAMTQMNRANALANLGERAGGEQGPDYLQQALNAYDLALKIGTRKDMPTDWAITQANRANALASLGERAGNEKAQGYLQQAIDAYDLALEIFAQPGMEYYAETTRNNRQLAVDALAKLKGDG